MSTPADNSVPDAASDSAFAPLFKLLEQYHQATRQNLSSQHYLEAVQQWQKQRLALSHQALFEQKNHQLMAQFFLNRLYGNNETTEQLAEQISRTLRFAQKIEKMVPQNTINTAILSIEIALKALLLDIEIANWLAGQQPDTLSSDTLVAAYQALDQQADRLHLLDHLEQFGHAIDRYARSLLVTGAFKLARGSAYRHNMQFLYDFIADGFAATKPLKSAEAFLKDFTAVERQIVGAVHQNQPQPFGSQLPPDIHVSA